MNCGLQPYKRYAMLIIQVGIQKFQYVSNCALSSGAICLKIVPFDCLSLCHVFFLWHLDVEKLRYCAKSDSTFVVSVEKWASNKERTFSFVLNLVKHLPKLLKWWKKLMATIVYSVAAFTSGLNVFKRDGRLWKTMNVRAGQETLWTKKTRKLCVNSSEKSRNHRWNTWNRN